MTVTKKLYSLEDCNFTSVSVHGGGRNQIVIVSRDGEKLYVLRISAFGDRTEKDYLAETEFVRYLAENGAPVADVIPSVNGKLVEVLDGNGTDLVAVGNGSAIDSFATPVFLSLFEYGAMSLNSHTVQTKKNEGFVRAE